MKWIKVKPDVRTYVIQAIVGTAVFALVLVFDLVTKYVTEGMDRLWIIEGVLSFVSVHNTGGAWSMFNDNAVVMTIIKVFTFIFVAAALIIMYYPDGRKNAFFIVTLALLGSGALGNLIDRLAFGYVRDFIRFDIINFPVFNIADVALVTGVIMLIVYIIWQFVRSERKARQEKKDAENASESDADGGDGK